MPVAGRLGGFGQGGVRGRALAVCGQARGTGSWRVAGGVRQPGQCEQFGSERAHRRHLFQRQQRHFPGFPDGHRFLFGGRQFHRIQRRDGHGYGQHQSARAGAEQRRRLFQRHHRHHRPGPELHCQRRHLRRGGHRVRFHAHLRFGVFRVRFRFRGVLRVGQFHLQRRVRLLHQRPGHFGALQQQLHEHRRVAQRHAHHHQHGQSRRQFAVLCGQHPALQPPAFRPGLLGAPHHHGAERERHPVRRLHHHPDGGRSGGALPDLPHQARRSRRFGRPVGCGRVLQSQQFRCRRARGGAGLFRHHQLQCGVRELRRRRHHLHPRWRGHQRLPGGQLHRLTQQHRHPRCGLRRPADYGGHPAGADLRQHQRYGFCRRHHRGAGKHHHRAGQPLLLQFPDL